MHLVFRFLLKSLSPTPETLTCFPIYLNHPTAVRTKIRLPFNSGQIFKHEPAPNLALKLAPKLARNCMSCAILPILLADQQKKAKKANFCQKSKIFLNLLKYLIKND
jgi:hypothetical protein